MCDVFKARRRRANVDNWYRELEGLSEWLDDLPKPIAVLAWSDVRGRQVTEACRLAGLRVPEDVAVLGAEFDELTDNLSNPPLSAVDVSAERVGYSAARLLDEMMSGQPAPREPVLIKPRGIVERHSTDVIAVDDQKVASAMRFIRQNYQRRILVDDIARHVLLSRRGLEQRFKKMLGRTPSAEIRRIRLDHARHLLSNTDLPIARVSQACGIEELSSFSRSFSNEIGMSPNAFRRQSGSQTQ